MLTDIDQVVSYEVVLADGSIVITNDKTNTDLFRVFKVEGMIRHCHPLRHGTLPARHIWDCNLVCPKESTAEVA
jgi:hypothetical protein